MDKNQQINNCYHDINKAIVQANCVFEISKQLNRITVKGKDNLTYTPTSTKLAFKDFAQICKKLINKYDKYRIDGYQIS